MRGAWLISALALIAVVVGLLFGSDRAESHVNNGEGGTPLFFLRDNSPPNDPDAYLWSGSCGSGTRKDPVNIVFAGVSSMTDLTDHFADHLPNWKAHGGSDLKFSQHNASDCSGQDLPWATGPTANLLGCLNRDHIRFKLGDSADPVYGTYYLAAAHHDRCWLPVVGPHCGQDFDAVRNAIRMAFTAGGHLTSEVSIGNTTPTGSFPCPQVSGDGSVAVIWVESSPTPTVPTLSVGSLSLSNVGDQGKVNVEALMIGPPGLGSWTIDVSYDSAVVSLISCAPASFGGQSNCNDAFATDTLRVIGTIGGGLIGDSVLVSLTFRCESAGISSLVINPESLVFFDGTPGDPQAIDADIQDGSINCVEPSTPTPTVTPTPTKQPAGDTDGDGCTDTQENGPDETFGGRRDYRNFWDFFDPNRDGSVSVLDFLAILGRFGAVGDPLIDPLSDPPPAPAYHTRFDRTGAPPGENPWQSGPPDGVIALGDFLALLTQFGHTCQ